MCVERERERERGDREKISTLVNHLEEPRAEGTQLSSNLGAQPRHAVVHQYRYTVVHQYTAVQIYSGTPVHSRTYPGTTAVQIYIQAVVMKYTVLHVCLKNAW